eukprot:COSAG05_NODE_73_length_21807_cov_283.593698_5_plen_128_part_00
MGRYGAVLRVWVGLKVNSLSIQLTKEDVFVLETVASEIGADQDKIDECIDDDEDAEINLIKLIFATDSGFLFWEHTPQQEKKKRKVASGANDGESQSERQGNIDLIGDGQDQAPSPNQQAAPTSLQI